MYQVIDTQAIYRSGIFGKTDRFEERVVHSFPTLARAIAYATRKDREHFSESGFGRYVVRAEAE